MKKTLVLCASAALLCACQSEGFVIDGSIAHADGAQVTLVQEITQERIDSTTIENGRFRLAGKVDTPERYLLEVNANPAGTSAEELDPAKIFLTAFYLENSKISVTADTETMPTLYWQQDREVEPAQVVGSAQEDLRRQLEERRSEVNDRLSELAERMMNEYYLPMEAGKTDEAGKAGVEIAREEQQAMDERQQITLDFARENPGAAVSFDEISYLMSDIPALTAAQIDELTAILAPAWEGTPKFEQFKEQAAKARKLAVGEPYIDCEFYNLDGELVPLSSVVPKGRYVMLEFWASWCGPCRGEIPHLKHVRKAYPDFDIISISLDDKQEVWKKVLKEEGMDWTQLRDNGFQQGHAFNDYRVMGIPCCIILDPEGRFCKVNMRGAYLDAFLEDLYGR